jgi:hypothetical protein
MPAQQREPRNYIGLVNDEADQPRAAKAQPPFSRPLKDFIHGLLALVLERRSEAG